MKRERLANLLIDTADRMAAAADDEARWRETVEICTALGATSVNSCGFLQRSGQLAWTRNTLPDDWLEEYREARLVGVDATVTLAGAGRLPPVFDLRATPGFGWDAKRRVQLAALRERAGLRYCLTASFASGGLRRVLAITCREEPQALFGRGTAQAFASIGAMLSLQLAAPRESRDDNSSAFGVGFGTLSEAERRILDAMASGQGLLAIAADAGVAPQVLRGMLRTICAKLQVGTHHDALAMARARGLVAM
ncbi:autoinducer binding domain-containing protein [Mangrovicoccus sp. HB161399]|uniref:helix-turn-helix transcriptional regulator n=1 Tax=Mangrovicoccus sp. HB161399 TaxID=2720392 RepID=UPI0015521DF0|nr:autoinducer binding domain-containing protein [Mangrovicoccus sp. HB161399]